MANTLAPQREEIRPFFDRFFDMTDPLADLMSTRRTMNTLFDAVLRPLPLKDFSVPAIDLYNKAGTYMLDVALPGLDKKDITIEVEGKCLTISGTYAAEKEEDEKNKRYHYREVRRGSFSRAVTFPEDIDPDKVVATFDRGMLKIEIPSLRPAPKQKVAIT